MQNSHHLFRCLPPSPPLHVPLMVELLKFFDALLNALILVIGILWALFSLDCSLLCAFLVFLICFWVILGPPPWTSFWRSIFVSGYSWCQLEKWILNYINWFWIFCFLLFKPGVLLNKTFGCKFVAIKCIPYSLQHSVLQLLNSRIPLCLCLLITTFAVSIFWASAMVFFLIIIIIIKSPLPFPFSFFLSLDAFLELGFVGYCHNLASDGPVYILKCLSWSDILFCIQLLVCRLCVLVSLIIFKDFKGRSQAPCSVLAYHIATHRSWLLETCKVGWLWIMSFLHRSTFSIHGTLFEDYYLLA